MYKIREEGIWIHNEDEEFKLIVTDLKKYRLFNFTRTQFEFLKENIIISKKNILHRLNILEKIGIINLINEDSVKTEDIFMDKNLVIGY